MMWVSYDPNKYVMTIISQGARICIGYRVFSFADIDSAMQR
jgi:hypothetical protein